MPKSAWTTSGTPAAIPAPTTQPVRDATSLQGRGISTAAPTDGQALVYNAASGLWLPATVSGGSGSVDNYSTSETATNKVWINGKTIYRKVVSLGALPNATTTTVAHGISGATAFTSITGVCYGSPNWLQLATPWPDGSSGIGLYVDVTNIHVVTAINQSSKTGYAILEYTK